MNGLLRNLYAGQEATARTGHGTTDWLDLLAVQGILKNLLQHHNSKASILLIDRVPDELWTEAHDILQESGIKTIPLETKCEKAKWLSGEALQLAV